MPGNCRHPERRMISPATSGVFNVSLVTNLLNKCRPSPKHDKERIAATDEVGAVNGLDATLCTMSPKAWLSWSSAFGSTSVGPGFPSSSGRRVIAAWDQDHRRSGARVPGGVPDRRDRKSGSVHARREANRRPVMVKLSRVVFLSCVSRLPATPVVLSFRPIQHASPGGSGDVHATAGSAREGPRRPPFAGRVCGNDPRVFQSDTIRCADRAVVNSGVSQTFGAAPLAGS